MLPDLPDGYKTARPALYGTNAVFEWSKLEVSRRFSPLKPISADACEYLFWNVCDLDKAGGIIAMVM